MKTFILIAMLGLLAGCVGTRDAYRSADSLADTAYVVAEHYAAVLHEAANLKEAGRLPAEVVTALQTADNVARPLVIGDPTANPPTPGLKELSDAYTDIRSAETESALQNAVSNAVRAVASFINAVKEAARRQSP